MKHLALHVFVLILSVVFGFGMYVVMGPAAPGESALPPRPGQPHTDTFVISGFGDLQPLNPVSVKAKQIRTVNFRLVTAQGCITGSVPNDLVQVQLEMNKVKFVLVRNDQVFDFTVYINCGSEQIRLCGGTNIYCLPYGYPYNADVSISDIISTYSTSVSRVSVLLHEIMGHAIATWNEQYCLDNDSAPQCRGLPLFSPAPNWPEFMNTGDQSRILCQDICIERWDRTMYPVLVTCTTIDYDPCTGRFIQADGWSWDPVTGNWFDPQGRARFGPCNADHLRLDLLDQHWWRIPGQVLGFDFGNGLNQYVTVPVC